MTITRLYAAEDGTSHFEEMTIPLEDEGEIGRLSAPEAANTVIFRENEADYDYDWHVAPARQYVVLLNGAIEIEASSGEKRRFEGGDVLLLEDVFGDGHKTRNVGAAPRRSIFIRLE